MRNGEIILCSGIKLDKNYENVLSYSESSMVTLCRQASIYTGHNYSFIGRDNKVQIACRYEDVIYANYMAFINPDYGNKWMFAWVTNIRYMNEDTTEISFKLDVFSTWYDRFTLNQAFIEREHVTDDTPGKNTVPEKLEYGDYIVNDILTPTAQDTYNDYYYILATSVFPLIDTSSGTDKINGGNVGGGIYNKIPCGLDYYAYNRTENGIARLKRTIAAYDNSGLADAINSIFVVPQWTVTVDWETGFDSIWGRVNESNSAITRMLEYNGVSLISKPTTVDTYTPVNKKLLQFPYSYFIMSNGNGGNAIYKYEYFHIPLNENYIEFVLSGAIAPSSSVLLQPSYYKYSGVTNSSEALIGAKLPIGSWSSDTYINWLTQNSLNHKVDLALGMASIGAGLAMSGESGSSAGGSYLAGGIMKVANTMVEIQNAKDFMSPQAKGNINCGDVNFALNLSTFIGYKMSIKKEWAERLDKYFSRFGYQVNDVKTPSLTSRTVFNFIKVGGMDELVSGNIPANDLEEINAIFRKGVTIFHDYTKIGNYTISNPVVSS